MILKTSLKISSLILIAFPIITYAASSDKPLSLNQQSPLQSSLSCTNILSMGRGQKALLNAPPELKDKLIENWEPFLINFNQSWSMKAFDILNVVYMDRPNGREELRNFVQESIHKYLNTAPVRQTENLLESPSKQLQLPKLKSVEIRDEDTSFIDKYRLMDYAQVSWRVFDEILPPDYSTQGHFGASFDRNFSTHALPVMFQIAEELSLNAEAGLILKLMLVHNRFGQITNIAERRKDDEFIFRVGLYALSKFYFDRSHPFYYNKLWDSIEALKRIRDPQVRQRFQTLMIELSEDITSDHFYEKLKTQYPEDPEGASSHMKVLVQNLLRGLRSSGNIIQINMEDSVKQDFITRSDNPKFRQAIRNLIQFAHNMELELSTFDIIKALQSSGDKEALLIIANDSLNKNKHSDAYLAFLAAGDIEKAVELYLEVIKEDKEVLSFRFSSLYKTAFRANLINELEAALLEKSENFELLFEKEKTKLGRMSLPLTKTTVRKNLVDAEFSLRLSIFSEYSAQEIASYQSFIEIAQKREKSGDNLNAGGTYLIAAFYDELLKSLK